MKAKNKIRWMDVVCFRGIIAILVLLLNPINQMSTIFTVSAQPVKPTEEYIEYCTEIGEIYQICPEILEAMMMRESDCAPDAVSAGGDTGLLQVNPKWHRERMDRLGVTDLKDPYGNILVAADYLQELFEQYGDLPMVLMVYNGSADAEQRWDTGDYTDYAVEIMETAEKLEREHGK